jgi:peroxiredoxin Q/BCP
MIALQQTVPQFEAVATHGTFDLATYRGKTLVLYFYPRDNTPGCTTQGAEFRDAYSAFKAANTEIVGVSRDGLKTHQNFKKKMDFPFELISDPDETLCLMFNVMKQKKMYGKDVRGIDRSTFIIDENGILIHEWRSVKVPDHVAAVLQFVQAHATQAHQSS